MSCFVGLLASTACVSHQTHLFLPHIKEQRRHWLVLRNHIQHPENNNDGNNLDDE